MTQTTSIHLITVSREFGAGGSDLAHELGARLQWPVLDHDIVHRVAERLRLNDGTVEPFDEHPPSLLARIATVLIVPLPGMYSFPTATEVPTHDAIADATRRVIEDAAKSLPLIVVGHGAQCIFEDRIDTLSVRLVAPLHVRLSRVAARQRISHPLAAELVRRADEDRQAYIQRYFHRDWRSELLYDVQFNTGTIGLSEAATIVTRLVEQRSNKSEEAVLQGAQSE
jgi:cytidylate kinase